MRKKLLFVNPCPDIGGAEMSLLLLLRGLDQEKYDLHLLLPDSGMVAERACAMGVTVHTMQMHPMMIESKIALSVKNSLVAASEVNKYKRFIEKLNIDLLHINSYRVGIPFSLAARGIHVPTIWHIRDIPESKWKRKLVARSTQLATQVVTISNAVSDAIDLQKESHVKMVYNAVEIEQFQNTEPNLFRRELNVSDETIVLCSIGQLIPWKGHDKLIEAFAHLEGKDRYHLVIVGGNVAPIWAGSKIRQTYPQELLDLVAYYGLENHITFTGFRPDIPQILSDIDLYVHTTTSPEPFGRVLVEAMAAHKPVVAPRWGGIPEIVVENDTGWLFSPNNSDELVARLQSAAVNPDLLKTMGKSGYRRVKDMFTATQHVAIMDQIFSRLLAI